MTLTLLRRYDMHPVVVPSSYTWAGVLELGKKQNKNKTGRTLKLDKAEKKGTSLQRSQEGDVQGQPSTASW